MTFKMSFEWFGSSAREQRRERKVGRSEENLVQRPEAWNLLTSSETLEWSDASRDGICVRAWWRMKPGKNACKVWSGKRFKSQVWPSANEQWRTTEEFKQWNKELIFSLLHSHLLKLNSLKWLGMGKVGVSLNLPYPCSLLISPLSTLPILLRCKTQSLASSSHSLRTNSSISMAHCKQMWTLLCRAV